jgi:hypothetical protein
MELLYAQLGRWIEDGLGHSREAVSITKYGRRGPHVGQSAQRWSFRKHGLEFVVSGARANRATDLLCPHDLST